MKYGDVAMMQESGRGLGKEHYIRHKLFASGKSDVRRYAEIVIGQYSWWKLLKYELIIFLFGSLPGGVGLWLRKLFFPLLFKKTGKGITFGRNLTIRNGKNIEIGDHVILDDYSLLDGRGAQDVGVVIGDEVIINRAVMIVAKVGTIHIGSHSDVGVGTKIISQGGISIGEMVSLASDCKIGGGRVRTVLAQDGADPNGHHGTTRADDKYSNGPIFIGDRCTLFTGATVLDAVRVGCDSLIGAGAVVQEDVPDGMIAQPHQRLVMLNRQTNPVGNTADSVESSENGRSTHPAANSGERASTAHHDQVIALVYEAIDEINSMRAEDERINKSPETPLQGPTSQLDSLGLVNLIVATEDKLNKRFGISVDLTQQEAAAGRPPTMDNIEGLATRVCELWQQRDA